VPDSPVQRHSFFVAGLLVTFWTFLITFGFSVAIIFSTWILAGDSQTSIGQAFKVVIWGYLAMQGVPLKISDITLNLPFLGFIFITLVSLYRSSRWAIRSALHEEMKKPTLISLGVVSVASITYVSEIALLRYFVDPVNINWLEVMTKPTIMVIFMSILAVGAVGGTWSLIFDDLDDVVKRILKLIFRFSLLIISISTLFILVSIGMNYSNMFLVQNSLLGGIFATVAVIITGIGWLPNFFIWAWAWLSNVTVFLGVQSSISLTEVNVTNLPAWPWFAAFPTSLPPWSRLLVIVPIFIGVLMAMATRNLNTGIWFIQALFTALGVASVQAFLGYLSSGSLGTNLLSNFGISPKELFQKNMIWFLIGEVGLILLIILFRYSQNRKNQAAEVETE